MRDFRPRTEPARFAPVVEWLEDRAQPALLAPGPDGALLVPGVISDVPRPLAAGLFADPSAPDLPPSTPDLLLAAEPAPEEASPWAWAAALVGGGVVCWAAWEIWSHPRAALGLNARSWREYLLGLDSDQP